MSYKKMLVIFMEAKKAEITKVLGPEYGELYFNEEDKQELLALSEENAMSIYVLINMHIKRNASNLSVVVCPFCYIAHYIANDSCKFCKYGKRHKICADLHVRSNYRDIIIESKKRGYNLEEIFSNEFYCDLIETIEKENL